MNVDISTCWCRSQYFTAIRLSLKRFYPSQRWYGAHMRLYLHNWLVFLAFITSKVPQFHYTIDWANCQEFWVMTECADTQRWGFFFDIWIEIMLHKLIFRLLCIDQEYLAILSTTGNDLIYMKSWLLLWLMLTQLTIPLWWVKLNRGCRDYREWMVMLLLQASTSALVINTLKFNFALQIIKLFSKSNGIIYM